MNWSDGYPEIWGKPTDWTPTLNQKQAKLSKLDSLITQQFDATRRFISEMSDGLDGLHNNLATLPINRSDLDYELDGLQSQIDDLHRKIKDHSNFLQRQERELDSLG